MNPANPGIDETESIRRHRLVELNVDHPGRTELEARYGQVWDTQELGRDFEVKGFMAPYVVVRRRSDGRVGSLEFTHCPRLYFNWQEDK